MSRRARRRGTFRARALRWAVRVGATALVVLAVAGTLALQSPGSTATRTAPAAIQISSAHGTSFVPTLAANRPLFILALGSDARPHQRPERQRADSIHVIGVDRARRRATILGLPRDSWVHIPGHGMGKVNTAMALGGPSLMVRTVESVTGIRMDFWMLTSFQGLVSMVNGIGGLEVQVPYRMKDGYSGSDFRPGLRRMNGNQALAFSRDRHSVPNGDLERSRNQGRLLLAALHKLNVEVERDPTTIFRWLVMGSRNVETDLSFATLLDLGLAAARVPPRNVNNLVVPATTGFVGTASVVFIASSARSIYADMRPDGLAGR